MQSGECESSRMISTALYWTGLDCKAEVPMISYPVEIASHWFLAAEGF